MKRRLETTGAGGFTGLARLSLLVALAGAGAAGCGSSNSGNGPPQTDGGEDASDAASDGMQTDAAPEAATEASTGDAATDASHDGGSEGGKDGGKDGSVEAGSAAAVFSASPISLGAGNCGGAAVTQTFSIQNTGSAPLTVADSVTGSVFTVSPASLSVAPGQTGTLTITATVPKASAAGSALSGSLALTTNDPAHAMASIALSVTPTGATLAFDSSSPSAAAFGSQPENKTATIALKLDNTGNAPAMVSLAAPGGVFGLSPATGTVTAGGSETLTATFAPVNTTAQNAMSTITVSGAVCGTSVGSLAFSGQGATGNVTGWPTATIDFGLNACGGAAAAGQTFKLTNSGPVDAHISSITFGGYAGYTTNAAVGATVPANGGALTVSVAAPPVPFPSAVPGNYAATVTFATDEVGDTPHQVNLTEEAQGAILAFDTSATPNFGAFGPVPVSSTASENFAVKNTGNATSSVTVADSTPFSVSTPTFNLTGGSSQSDSASFAPATFGSFSSTLSMTGTNLCQPIPAALKLSGTGEAGGIAITNTPTPFAVNCNATAAPQQLTITNSGNQPMTWSGVLSSTNTVNGTWYAISPGGAMLAPGASSTVTVTPVMMPQYPANPTNVAQFNDTIVVTTDIPGDTAHNVGLSETPLGDILSYNTGSFSFGPTPINTPETAPFTITNSANAGSAQASVTIASKAPDFTVTPASAAINAGATSGNINVTFQSATPGSYTGDIGITTADVLCQPLPTDLTPSATATEAGPVCNSVGGGPCALSFGLVNCGSTATAAQLFMTNSGNQAYLITGLKLATGTYFTVAMVPASGVVAPGGTVTITVTPQAIPGTVPSVPDNAAYSDSLTITTNANVAQPVFTAPLGMGAQGVIITSALATTTWDFGTVNYGSTGLFDAPIQNAGNEKFSVTLSGTLTSFFNLQTNPAVDPSPPDVMTVVGTFTPAKDSTTHTDSGVLTVAPVAGAVLCQPLPASWVTPTILFRGTDANNPIISISPTSLPFPAALCGGSNPAGETVTISNNSGTPQAYSAALGAGTYYTITAGGSGSVPANGTAQVTVRPSINLAAGGGAATGSSQYDDTVVITVAGSQYYIPLTETVNGVILSAQNPQNYSFSGYLCQGDPRSNFPVDFYAENYFGSNYAYSPTIVNNGNITGSVTATFTGCDSTFMASSPASASVNPGSTQTFSLSNPNGPGGGNWYGSTMTFSSPNSCNAPLAIPVAGYRYP